MKMHSAKFVTSIVEDHQLLHDGKPQIAFIGRSNVGKSSLMNMLMQRKDLVKSSGTPGKTRTVNFFLVNEEVYFVDLPGYGYAKLSRTQRDSLRDLIVWYLTDTPNTKRHIILVTDAKTGVTDIDMQMIELLQTEKIPFILVANKTDKLNQKDLHALRVSLENLFSEGQSVVYASAVKKTGRDKIFEAISLS